MGKEIRSIHIDSLLVNALNDRHGELADEAKAMNHLLTTKPAQMKKLAKDIAEERQIYIPPLVALTGEDSFTVFDGNRRVTCLKLLLSPHSAPNDEWREFFLATVEGHADDLPNNVDCLVETDQDVIDNILFRLHTGSQDGIGQIDWDNVAKANFIDRTGKSDKINLPQEIEKRLRQDGLIAAETKVLWSSVARLLSSEEFRYRVGLSVKANEIAFTHDPTVSLLALKRIVEDAHSGTLNLNRLLKNSEKRAYLTELERDGILPTATHVLETPIGFHDGKAREKRQPTSPPTPPSPPPVPSPPKPRQPNRLIRPNLQHGITPTPELKRILDIWTELQHHHEFGKHDNGIAVLFRVLLELAVEHYVAKHGVAVHKNDKFANRFRKVADHMLGGGLIDAKYDEIISKFENSEPILSANTFNKYVHHKDFFPSDHHLRSMWDSLERYVLICLKA